MFKNYKIDYFSAAHRAIGSKEAFIRKLLPHGRRDGHEWTAYNPTRYDGHLGSFKVNMISGKWGDFSTGDYGHDLISLMAYVKRISRLEAACLIAGIEAPKRRNYSIPKTNVKATGGANE